MLACFPPYAGLLCIEKVDILRLELYEFQVTSPPISPLPPPTSPTSTPTRSRWWCAR